MTREDLPDIMTVSDVKEFLRIGKNQAYELVNKNDFPKISILGRTIRISKIKFLEWLDKKIVG